MRSSPCQLTRPPGSSVNWVSTITSSGATSREAQVPTTTFANSSSDAPQPPSSATTNADNKILDADEANTWLNQRRPLRGPLFRRVAPESALGELMPAADHESDHEIGLGGGIRTFGNLLLGNREAQRLLKRCLQPVMQLVDARLQAFIFVDKNIADQHTRHAGVLLGKTKQRREDRLELLEAIGFFRGDLVDQAEQGLLDELDQTLEHLRLAREMPVERRLGNVEPGRERGGGYFLPLWILEHARKCLQNLQLSFSRLGWHSGSERV